MLRQHLKVIYRILCTRIVIFFYVKLKLQCEQMYKWNIKIAANFKLNGVTWMAYEIWDKRLSIRGKADDGNALIGSIKNNSCWWNHTIFQKFFLNLQTQRIFYFAFCSTLDWLCMDGRLWFGFSVIYVLVWWSFVSSSFFFVKWFSRLH